MDELSTDENLYRLWMLYTAKSELPRFRDYLSAFVDAYEDFVDVEFSHLKNGFSPQGPHLTKLPEGLLQVLSKQLVACNAQCSCTLDLDTLHFAECITKCLIIICRNLDNVAFISSCEYVSHLVTISTMVLSELSKGNTEFVDQLSSFVRHSLHLFECMYDPYFIWRKEIRVCRVERNRLKYQAALLHVEIVPFFYECFQQGCLDVDVQIRLFNLFGAIVCGSQHNALKAICPATLDVILKALSSTSGMGPTNAQREEVMGMKELVLQCFVRMVHVVHMCPPEQRQVEVGLVLEGFFQVLLGLQSNQHNSELQLKILNTIHEMLRCENHETLQVIFVAEGTFETFVSFIRKITPNCVDAQRLCMAVIRAMNAVMTDSFTAKDNFREKIGYCRFVEALKSLGQPSQELLSTILDLVVEKTYNKNEDFPIRNTQAVLMLVQWLPDIQCHKLQIWLSGCLKLLCSSSTHNQMHCCNEGMISTLIHILGQERQISRKAVCNLIDLMEVLGTLSITASEVRQLLCLLKPGPNNMQSCYLGRIMHTMSVMARKDDREGVLYYFDFEQENSGILVSGGIGKWPGTGFSFHGWICLDNQAPLVTAVSHLARRQLYSFMSSTGNGFEAFFTAECVLVIATCLKKEYHTISVTDCPITDHRWHCIDVVHASSRSHSSASQLSVYVDGNLKLSAQVKFPSTGDPFLVCQIGSPGIKVGLGNKAMDAFLDHSFQQSEVKSKIRVPGLFKLGFSAVKQFAQSASVSTVALGSQDETFGVPASLIGQLGSVCVFCDQLQPQQIKTMYMAGPNCMNLFQSEDNGLSDLTSKLVFHFNAKASQNNICLDLSPQQHHGQIASAKRCVTWDIKNVINCVGGIQVLFPLLEQVGRQIQQANSPSEGFLIQGANTPPDQEELDESDWVMVPSSSYADAKLEQNQVAGFLALLRNLIQTCPINQEMLVRENVMAVLGMLLQKMDPPAIDVHVLMAVQTLVEAIVLVNKVLLHQVYQYLLFDFRVWSKSEFPVRIGHIQYLSTIIKEDRKYFRKRYGVQYMLDICRTFYSATNNTKLSEDDCRTIRGALFSLIKYYVHKEITYEELSSLIGFTVAVKEEILISEALDLILSLLEIPGKRDQIYLLMFEPQMAELLYRFLTMHDFSAPLKEKVLKIVSLLLKSDRVYDKSKTKLRLLDSGIYPGLVGEMLGSQVSHSMARQMFEQVLATESEAGMNAALYIIQLLYNADMDTKLEASRKLMSALFSKSTAPKIFVKQLSWQESITKLLVVCSRTPNLFSTSTTPINPSPSNSSIFTTSECTEQSNPTDLNVHVEPSSPEVFTSDNTCPASSRPQFFLPLRSTNSQHGLSGSESPSMSSPKFGKPKLFEDNLSLSDTDPYNFGISSRSSSASVEDLTSKKSNISALSSSGLSDASSVATDLESSTTCETDGAAPDSSSASNLTASSHEARIKEALERMGLNVNRKESMEKTEELCQNLLLVLFTVAWKGVDTSDMDQAWKERGQVFAAMAYLEENYELLKPKVELEKHMLELMLQACITDLKETGQSSAANTQNALMLVKLVYHFLCLQGAHDKNKFTERIIEDVITLMDLTLVWETEDGWREMEQLGLTLLLAFAGQDDLNLCSIASARLHTLLQTRPVEKLQESCFVMEAIDSMLSSALCGDGDQYNFLIPVMKALVDKTYNMLNMKSLLPNLPTTQMSPTFFDDFKTYSQSEEWKSFIEKQVAPSKEQYLSNSFDIMQVWVKTFIGECHELMMNNTHKRNRDRGESKLKFQTEIVEMFSQRARIENKRFQNITSQLRNQHNAAQRQWRSMKMFFTGERGIWPENLLISMKHGYGGLACPSCYVCKTGRPYHTHAADQITWTSIKSRDQLHWRLSTQENFCRMRPKSIPNHTFDFHTDASRLRDNLVLEDEELGRGVEERLAVLPPIELVKEAKVQDHDIGDDRVGDEEWNVMTSDNDKDEENTGKEKLLLTEDCDLITIMDTVKGRLEVTNTHLYFFDTTPNKEEGEDFKFALSQLREMHLRRYNLRRSALEFFFIDQTNFFINFEEKVRNKVYGKIASQRPPNLVHAGSRSPSELLKASGLTHKWVHREINNFEYIMQLNTIAGRTYNDLSQYPVFPWVLCDYTSSTLDLNNPAVYRDLSKPIGAVNPKNEAEVKEKFENFEDPSGTIAKFHYGTHYSNAAGVMHFLLRLEPFTSLHIKLQSGRFDVADRQFHSITNTWQSLMENPNDVKELIPEFFYLPEFLENREGFDLGRLQITKETVDDVGLPPWADSPEDFINKNMKALESEYVSQNIHNWIDLIFGYKQRGQAAIDALNVFYYCTYEGAVDLDNITDPVERKAIEGMINNFGQTPRQLLRDPHPRRMTFEDMVSKAVKVDKPLSVLLFSNQLKAFYVEPSVDKEPLVYVSVPRNQQRSFIQQGMPDSMIAISESGVLAVHGWLPYDKAISNYFTFERDNSLGSNKTKKRLHGPFAPGQRITWKIFVASHDAKYVYSGGHWDNSLRVYNVSKAKTTGYFIRHADIITCLALDYCGNHLITGSKDTTCIIWQQTNTNTSVISRPLQTLCGHTDEITSVAISIELDMAVSGSKDGTVIVHTVRKGLYLHTLLPPCEPSLTLSVEQLAISDVGHVCVYCRRGHPGRMKEEKLSLHLYSTNGKHLCTEVVYSAIVHMLVTSGHLIFGNKQGVLVTKELFGLTTVSSLPLHVPVTCLALTNNNTHILIGLDDGKLIVVGIKKPSEYK